MNKINLLTGGNGKLGQLLRKRPNFHFLDCDVTNIDSIRDAGAKLKDLGFWEDKIVVNLAAVSSVDECEQYYEKALEVNRTGLANLHRVFGERVLNISSDQVFSGNSLILPNEYSAPKPVNNYGFTKLGAEAVSLAFGGKTLRLSRTVSLSDPDIDLYLTDLLEGDTVSVPTFFARNYLHREFAVDGIEFMVRNWDNMPQIVNYGGDDHISMFGFMKMLVMELGLDYKLLEKNHRYDNSMTPRPRNGGFKVGLAEELGFPMYSAMQTCQKLKGEFHV
jgi:dTDP-4-dehydrorhamnose reductase